MARYVLGEAGARKFRALLASRSGSGRRPGGVPGVVDSSSLPAPFTVRYAASVGDGGAWIVWLPDGACCVIDGGEVDLRTGLEAAGGDYPEGWYIVDALSDTGGNLVLKVTRDDGETTAEFALAEESGEESAEHAFSVPVAVCSRNTTTGEVRIQQLADGAIVVGCATDGDSVDSQGGEGGAALQIAHFADDERDSGKGLAVRLKADVQTGEITAESDDTLMLIARKDGKIVYVPLSGDGEDPAEESDDAADPCGHPGDPAKGGGVSADDSSGGGGGGGWGPGSAGGVPATDSADGGGGTHKGDDNCNCN